MVRLLVLTYLLFLSIGCTRPISENSLSSLTIKVPAGLGTLSVFPPDRKACFGVSVTGTGGTGQGGVDDLSPSRGNSCSPSTGLIAGFVEAGATIEASVPKGSKRKIELFAYLMPPGDNGTCPRFTKSMSTTQATSTYIVGSVTNVDMSNDVTTVEITADFPGLANHVAQQQNLALTCGSIASEPNKPGFFVSGGLQEASGGGFKMISRMGRSVGRVQGDLTGGNVRLITQ